MINRASLRTKLTLGFVILMAIMISMSTVDYFSMQTVAQLSTAVEVKITEMYLARTIEADVNARKADVRAFVLSGNEDHITNYKDQTRDLFEAFADLEPMLTTEQGKRLFAQLRQESADYDRAAERVIDLKRARKTQEATDLLLGPEMSAARAAMESTEADFVKLCQEIIAHRHQEETDAESRAVKEIIVLGIVGLAVAVVLATAVPRHISRRVGRMLEVMKEIAANNLAIPDLEITSHDELSRADEALNAMKNNLSALMQTIARTAESVASASKELSSASTQQASGAAGQSDQVTQVATAMEEMSATVREVSENSNRAAEASRQAAETARDGGNIVENSLNKMRAIADSVSATAHKVADLGKSSDQIGRIIGVIDDIADQTNLLALNAAIEAARAGAQGRGFAVVADEVRKLAERTTAATKEVAQMVESIQVETKNAVAAMDSGTRQVNDGVETTAQAGHSLKQIIQMSEQVGEMITHIATAATEQSSATEQINQNVTQIADLAKEAAAGAEQSAKASEELSHLATEVQKMVGRFKLQAGPASSAGALRRQEPVSRGAETTKAFAAGVH